MLFMSVDITKHLQEIFSFMYSIYNFLDSLKFRAFGYDFSLLGIMLSLIVLIVLIKFMRFGVEVGADTTIRYARAENNKEQYLSKHREGSHTYISRHQPLRSAKYNK